MHRVPAPAPSEDAAAEESTDYADYAPPYYPPKPSAGTWFSWLPEDPILLAGVIISFLSGEQGAPWQFMHLCITGQLNLRRYNVCQGAV